MRYQLFLNTFGNIVKIKKGCPYFLPRLNKSPPSKCYILDINLTHLDFSCPLKQNSINYVAYFLK